MIYYTVMSATTIGYGVIVNTLCDRWLDIWSFFFATPLMTTPPHPPEPQQDMHPDKTAAYAVALCYLPLAVMAVANAINTIAVSICFVNWRGLCTLVI